MQGIFSWAAMAPQKSPGKGLAKPLLSKQRAQGHPLGHHGVKKGSADMHKMP